MAETVSVEVQGWLSITGLTVRNVLLVSGLLVACSIVWRATLLVGKFLGPQWPSWSSPYAQAKRETYAGAGRSISDDVRRRGMALRAQTLSTIGTAQPRLEAPRGARFARCAPREGARRRAHSAQAAVG